MSNPMRRIAIAKALHTVCDICGKNRGGTGQPSHKKCSKIRQQRGFSNDPQPTEQHP